MSQYAYIKAPPGYTIKKAPSILSRAKLILSLIFTTIGVAAITSVAYPLISYQLSYAPGFKQSALLSPQSTLSVPQIRANEPSFSSEMVNTTLDYTDSENWFPQAKSTKPIPTDSLIYKLSIPALNIKDALVRNDTTDLKTSLIQYHDTALPGNLGNPVIFGHSVLPQFFDPTNYTTIFSTLYTLKKGDEILVDHDGLVYRYVIQKMYEVVPTDFSPLEQKYDNRYLTLITCTPPGTYLKRLVVVAILI